MLGQSQRHQSTMDDMVNYITLVLGEDRVSSQSEQAAISSRATVANIHTAAGAVAGPIPAG
eukprot:12556784-Prorocentrum_lima.AAC.1